MKMNLKFFALAAVAVSVTLVSCNKTQTVSLPGTPKSVTIKLSNVVPGTRSMGGEQIAAGTKVTLNDFQVFFTDGTTLYLPKNIDNTDYAETYFDGTGGVPTEASFHFLPAQVTSVVVIGNIGSKITVENGVTALSELQNRELEIAGQQDIDNLTLYSGVQQLQLASDASHMDAHDTPVYTADLTLAPRIARLFVKDFTYSVKSDASVYKTLEMLKMAINNYYGKTTLGGSESELTSQEINTSTVWNWFSGFTDSAWNWDDLSSIKVTVTAANTPVSVEAGGLYYHFFVDDDKPQVPQLVLQCVSDDEPQYLATLNFKDSDGEPIAWENGYIYEMSFSFTDEQLSHPDKCVDITVNPVEWQVVTVTPEF